jgi:GT2 family glycosyltransferase
MVNSVNVIMPTAGNKIVLDALSSLSHLHFPIHLHLITNHTYWGGINAGILHANETRDYLFMDDDVRLTAETFNTFYEYYDEADIFGFKLLFENDMIQHAGVEYINGTFEHRGYFKKQSSEYDEKMECVAVCGALMYVKKHVIDDLKGWSTDYKGNGQYLDIDFCLRAKKRGYKILYVPCKAYHFEDTRKHFDTTQTEKTNTNFKLLKEKHPEFFV